MGKFWIGDFAVDIIIGVGLNFFGSKPLQGLGPNSSCHFSSVFFLNKN